MPKDHKAELSKLRVSALKIADQLEREHRPREYSGELHVPEPPSSCGGGFQSHIRMMPPRPGEFDPTPQQDMAAALKKLAEAVDKYLESGSDTEPGSP